MRRALKDELKTAQENIAIAHCNHQVAQQNSELSAVPGKTILWLFSSKKRRFGNGNCLEEGSESDTIETVTQHLNFILLPVLH